MRSSSLRQIERIAAAKTHMPDAPLSVIPDVIELPTGLLEAAPWLDLVNAGTTLTFNVGEGYTTWKSELGATPEVVGIQRLISLARKDASFEVLWNEKALKTVLSSAAIFPLLAIVLLLSRATHRVRHADGSSESIDVGDAVRPLLKHRLARDLFADSEMVVCLDGRGAPLPWDIYLPHSQTLRPREDFETLVVDALTAQVAEGTSRDTVYRNASSLGTVVAELVENTDMHGRLDVAGRALGTDAFRGLIFKRIKMDVPYVRPARGTPTSRMVEFFEVSVFDSGVGYFEAYTRGEQARNADLNYEWKVLHNCLERHYHPDVKDHSAGHRAMGLYEVLKAIQVLKGRIEIRTGRLYAYRTFLDGELQAQMTLKEGFAYHGWPVPKLLDVNKRYLARPSEHEPLCGSSVRIVIPLN
jgi:hypothetical protein